MRDSDSGTLTALSAASARGLVPRNLVTILARPIGGGDPEQFCFWNGVLPVDVALPSGATGEMETRSFAADNSLLDVGTIRLTTDLTVRPVTVRLNSLHPRVDLLLRSFDVRLAPIEIHRVPLDPDSQLLAGVPACRFFGVVETMPRTVPAAGSEGNLTLNCISDTVQLTRANPIKRSDEAQKRRSGDRMLRYAALAPTWPIEWGEAEGTLT